MLWREGKTTETVTFLNVDRLCPEISYIIYLLFGEYLVMGMQKFKNSYYSIFCNREWVENATF